MTRFAGRVVLCAILAAGCGSGVRSTGPTDETPPAPTATSSGKTPTPPPTSTSSPPPPPHKPKPEPAEGPFPIVLMHGMGGFNQLENLPLTVSYFNGVQADLEAHGEPEVFVTVTAPFDTSENRAALLKPQLLSILSKTGAKKLNLIGHSQGGLDARILASPDGLGMGDVIASVTTIATPHRGTPVTDLAIGAVSGLPASTVSSVTNALLQLLENGVYAVHQSPNLFAQLNEMTTDYMAKTFNPTYGNAKGVVYASYAGRTNLEDGSADCGDAEYENDPSALDIPQPELSVTADYIQSLGVESDGLVPISSAKWGTFMECVPADHLKEVGMLFQDGPDPVSGYDHLLFFRAVVARLRTAGL